MDEDAYVQLEPFEEPELLHPDLRADRSDSAEGEGRARARLEAFYDEGPGAELAIELAGARGYERDLLAEPEEELAADERALVDAVRDEITTDALEEADLIGFWVAWHRAGGFRGLERAGWHRTTIFRRSKQFRLRFGRHPDAHVFPWITLDLERCWAERFQRAISLADYGPEED